MTDKQIKDAKWVIKYAYEHDDDYVNWTYVQSLKENLNKEELLNK